MSENPTSPSQIQADVLPQFPAYTPAIEQTASMPRWQRNTLLLTASALSLSTGIAGGTIARHMVDSERSETLPPAPTPELTVGELPTAEYVPVQNIEIDCSKTDYELPKVIDANIAKEAMSHIELFIDDPDQVVQIKNAINEATTQQEVQQIVSAVFTPRGVELLFDQVPSDIRFNPTDIPIESYRGMMNNFVDAYARIPAKIGKLAPTVYLTNGLYTVNDANADGIVSKDEHRPVGGLASDFTNIMLDINTFGSFLGGLGVLHHELLHNADARTCRVPGTDDTYDTAYYNLRQASPITQQDLGYDKALAINTTATPQSLEEILKVVSNTYGLATPAEDIATSIAPLAEGDFPDQSDPDFSDSTILYQKQELIVGRLAEALDIPELAQYYAFTDKYGPFIHPKIITKYDVSPYQAELVSGMFASPDYNYYNSEFKNLFTPIKVTLPNGNHDTLFIYKDAKGDMVSLSVRLKVNGDVNTDCQNLPEVQQLSKYLFDVASYVAGSDKDMQQYISSWLPEISEGKVTCDIYTSNQTQAKGGGK